MLPAERATLQQPDQRVAGIAEEAEHDGRAQHLRDQEEIAPVIDQIAEAVLGADELRDHDDEERQRQPEAHAREDLGSAAGSRTRKKSWRGRAPRLSAARTRS